MKLVAVAAASFAYRTVPETKDYTGAQTTCISAGKDMITSTLKKVTPNSHVKSG